MPILTIQRRMAEQGRIRLGLKDGRRPVKLETFRLTSPNDRLIRQVADLYGGTPQPWTADGRAEWQVTTEATSLPVIVVKGGVSQWMEQWSRGGCTVRCDGEQMQGGKGRQAGPCRCAAMPDGTDIPCKPTTRLSVMLRDVETMGTWRVESHGWSAAAELPGPAELAAHFGDLVPATLHLVKRKAISDGKTKEFMVPVLDLEVSKQRLVAIAAAQAGGDAPAPAQVAAPAAAPALEAPMPDYERGIADAADDGQLERIYEYARAHDHLTDALSTAIRERRAELRAAQQPTEVVEAEVLEDEPPAADDPNDVEAAWYQVQMVAGQAGMGLDALDDFTRQVLGKGPDQASVADLRRLHTAITTGEVPA